MNIEYFKIDSSNSNFEFEFFKIKDSFFQILENTYPNYFGRNYHLNRIIESKAVIYLATLESNLIGVSYVKRNLRREHEREIKLFHQIKVLILIL